MCIVSFVKSQDEFILTFNRDERKGRESEPPSWRSFNEKLIYCPLDKEAGGTWIGYNHEIIACLQNGSYEKHIRQLPYEVSRGKVLLELLLTNDFKAFKQQVINKKIEPFTLSIYSIDSSQLSVYRCSEKNISIEEFSLKNPVVICSSTLYNSMAQQTIEGAFSHLEWSAKSIFDFHDERRIGEDKNRFTNLVDTVSITQFVFKNGQLSGTYYDPLNGVKLILLA